MRRPPRPVLWTPFVDLRSGFGFTLPNILSIHPHHSLRWLFGGAPPEELARMAQLDRTLPDAEVWRLKYVNAWRRSKRHKPGSRRWAYHRRQMLRFRDRVNQTGHRISAGDFEMHAG